MTTLETISQYQILETIGKGAFGTVKSAIRLTDQRKVAIKFISKTHLKNNKSRIQSEINIHASLNNIHIVRLYRVFADKEFIYLVMELLESDLFNFISKNGPLNEHSLVPILTDLIKGLEYLHAQNIIHRDLKLSNMLLTRDKKLKVADFGLAVRITSAEQKTMCGYIINLT